MSQPVHICVNGPIAGVVAARAPKPGECSRRLRQKKRSTAAVSWTYSTGIWLFVHGHTFRAGVKCGSQSLHGGRDQPNVCAPEIKKAVIAADAGYIGDQHRMGKPLGKDHACHYHCQKGVSPGSVLIKGLKAHGPDASTRPYVWRSDVLQITYDTSRCSSAAP